MGRDTDYTQEDAARFILAIRTHGFVSSAADKARISRRKIYRWLERGERGEEPFATFLADVREARADVQGDLKGQALSEPRNATWFLERMFPAEYGMRERVEQAAQEQLQHLLDSIIGELSDGAREELLAAVARHAGVAAVESAAVAGRASAEGETDIAASVRETRLLPARTDR